MKNKNIIIGASALLLAGVGLYFIFRGAKKDATPIDSTPKPTPEPLPIESGYKKYTVETLVSNLNVRQSPSTSSAVVGSLPKGSVIFAKPSSTSGWYSYSEDGTKEKGFVSSLYIKPLN
jgi:uncharacterized protein YgiM (DUF1202 family)